MVHVMSEITRYDVPGGGDVEKCNNGDYVRHADHLIYLREMRMDRDVERLRADTAEADLARTHATFVNATKVENEKWSVKLAAAEQRIAGTVAKLQLAVDMLDDDERGNRFAQVLRLAIAALNPNPEAESHEPSN